MEVDKEGNHETPQKMWLCVSHTGPVSSSYSSRAAAFSLGGRVHIWEGPNLYSLKLIYYL